ncbi:MAG: hypothetical protein JXR55_06915, partial [Candidatus Fermentibacteraceae bacterium]|nr:hypothetical protein [Candidatus Fermentibacteraceae bacterium]
MKNLVYVAYTFPPVSTGSAPMNLRLADIFVRNGWMPTVVTAERTGGMPVDHSLVDLLPAEMRIRRTGGTSARGNVPSSVRPAPAGSGRGRKGLR